MLHLMTTMVSTSNVVILTVVSSVLAILMDLVQTVLSEVSTMANVTDLTLVKTSVLMST